MSTFEVPVVELDIEPHPDADRLDIAKPRGLDYVCVVQKNRFSTGSKAIYVPEQAILPEELLKKSLLWDEEKGKGILAGSRGDRVKAIKLRGVLSQGVLLDGELEELPVGHDCQEELGIKKYMPNIHPSMSGKVYYVESLRSYTDIENVKKYPNVLDHNEEVVITEKLHGTCAIFSFMRGWGHVVSSKGQAKRGLALEESKDNVYWKVFNEKNIGYKLELLRKILAPEKEVTLFGEIIGVQDLEYGYSFGKPGFRAFDIRVDGRYLDYEDFARACRDVSIATVPLRGIVRWSKVLVEDGHIQNGRSELADHIAEGCVIRPTRERYDDGIGRVILKSISESYLTRKNATEME